MKKNAIKTIVLAISLLFSLTFIGEAKDVSEKQPPPIAAHTAGIIPSQSTIKVQFNKDQVPQDQINQPLTQSPLSFQPEIKGAAVWTDRHTLQFRPDEPLPRGTHYSCSFVFIDSSVFSFDFAVIKQAFEVFADGLLVTDSSKGNKMRFTGIVTVADAEDGLNVVKMFSALHADATLNIRWTHSPDRLEHRFTIDNILKQKNPSELVLEWNGASIGVAQKGKKEIAVPSIKPFKVLKASAVYGPTRHIEIRFSDELDKTQELRGLIRVKNKNNLRFTADGNIVKVYSSSAWRTEEVVTVTTAVRSLRNQRLQKRKTLQVKFETRKPQVRLVGKGVIVPTTFGQTVPFETVNLRAVKIEAIRIFDNTATQFFQANDIDGQYEMHQVGRVIWQKIVPLDEKPAEKNQWVRRRLDLTSLIKKNGSGLYRLKLSFERHHVIYQCGDKDRSDEDQDETDDAPQPSSDDADVESSYWDSYEQENQYQWGERKNPCNPAYYARNRNVVQRNVLISDIGLIAKKGSDDQLFIFTTDMKTAAPLADVNLTLLDYQQQIIAQGVTSEDGRAQLICVREPFLLVAQNNDQKGFLKLDSGSALSVSHFDVSGQAITKGLKGFIYGERGVWRPGDPIWLTFILFDEDKRLPENHPVLFELRNPKGKLIQRIKRSQGINGFYSFKTKTKPDAITGKYTAQVKVGGAEFTQTVRIETVIPNRLKIKLDFGEGVKSLTDGTINVQLSSRWLHGAIAKNLKVDMNLALAASPTTRFPKYDEYSFDDPMRHYTPEKQTLFEGELDEKGMAAITAKVSAKNVSPGMLTAHFRTRVFESGGAFSTDRFKMPFHPYKQYVGLRTPPGDKARGMLLTDTKHMVRIALLDVNGLPVEKGQVEVKLYKLKWRWWWEKSEDTDYVGRSSFMVIQTGKTDIVNGAGQWQFEIKYPEWGRYFVRVKDLNGKHAAGKIVYIDWPGWAGRASKDIPGGATVLTFSADKESHKVGETVTLTIPTGKKGRALVSIESGSKILHTAWVEAQENAARYAFTATPAMAPNVYANVTFLQPHQQTGNDLPIRMYGVIPLKIENPATRLEPLIQAPESFAPEEKGVIKIRESSGKAMTYTLAVVDEGLLDLTRFSTPNPWGYFYQREALGVKTWDIYNMVAGAYGGALERLLAIGGDAAFGKKGKKKAHRFPPMVKFLGPFELAPDSEDVHTIDFPQYVGSVRIMAVAGHNGAFGNAEQAVPVRKPLMVLATLPRVLSPEEIVAMPVSVFAMDETVKLVSLKLEAQGPLVPVDSSEKSIQFADPGDELVTFQLKASASTGMAKVKVIATSGELTATHTIEIDVRMPTEPVTDVMDTVLAPGEIWTPQAALPGIVGTNRAILEISRMPPINLEGRLRYLVRYPHGCVEQTTSSVFPQLWLSELIQLSPEQQSEIQHNIEAGIERLSGFQHTNGGFSYWPGQRNMHDWSSSYAGHFLLEAQRAGYLLPPGMLSQWKTFQQKQARAWTITKRKRSRLIQAYRLYTLALANAAELGAMNRLREASDLDSVTRYRLAAAYVLAGQPEAAEQLIKYGHIVIPDYKELSGTFGSSLRDRAMILETLCLMKRLKEALPLATAIAKELSSDAGLSTQTTAYALIAIANYTGLAGRDSSMEFTYSQNGNPAETIASEYPLVQKRLSVKNSASINVNLKNESSAAIFPRLIMEGIPALGQEKPAAKGFELKYIYQTLKGKTLDVTSLEQGIDFAVEILVTNTGMRGSYQEVALTHVVPSGWEIVNMRLDSDAFKEKESAFKYRFKYRDIRDDRVYTYFDIAQGQTKTFRIGLHAGYLGRFYLPMVKVEAMYDAMLHARQPGKWVTVVQPGKGLSHK
ncbi:MG2 domain-containing protein [Desulfococcaceae bacterium HSG7]|nr:MG2 domain-containing protein [Desulfococcaceae bacterium HSG7]